MSTLKILTTRYEVWRFESLHLCVLLVFIYNLEILYYFLKWKWYEMCRE